MGKHVVSLIRLIGGVGNVRKYFFIRFYSSERAKMTYFSNIRPQKEQMRLTSSNLTSSKAQRRLTSFIWRYKKGQKKLFLTIFYHKKNKNDLFFHLTPPKGQMRLTMFRLTSPILQMRLTPFLLTPPKGGKTSKLTKKVVKKVDFDLFSLFLGIQLCMDWANRKNIVIVIIS